MCHTRGTRRWRERLAVQRLRLRTDSATPTLALVGTKAGYDAPPLAVESDSESSLLLVGDLGLEFESFALGGSEYLGQHDGSDVFPTLPEEPAALIETIATVADDDATLATHDVSHGGLAVALAEMVTETAGLEVSLSTATLLAHCSTNSRVAS